MKTEQNKKGTCPGMLIETKKLAALQNQQYLELFPRESYIDRILAEHEPVTATAIARDYGISARTLHLILEENGVLCNIGGTWILTDEHAVCGYTITSLIEKRGKNGDEFSVPSTKWTPKGRLFIYELLKAKGILPDCERGCV